MTSSPDDGEVLKCPALDVAGARKPSELKLKVELRRDVIALVVNVDGLKLAAETCVTCPLGLVSILGGPEIRRNFTCESARSGCSGGRIQHSFNVERRGEELIWSRTNYPAGRSSVTFDYHQACVAVCEALLELKTAVDAHPDGISSCASMMPGQFTYDELQSCIDQSKRMVAESAKA